MADQNTPHRELLNKSGIPFQLAAERAVRSVGDPNGISVVGREVPWSAGFLDILARRGSDTLLAFECKRVQDDTWLFVLSDEKQRMMTRCRLEWFNPRVEEPALVGPGGHPRVFCSEWNLVEGSAESDFCIVPNNRPIKSLEGICRELLAASREILDNDERARSGAPEVIVPVILTNARLVTCRLDPATIDLATGMLPADHGEFQEVPFVRFRKTLSASRSNWFDSTPMFADRWVADRERTIFVVHPDGLRTFFDGFRSFFCFDPGGQPREFLDPPPSRTFFSQGGLPRERGPD